MMLFSMRNILFEKTLIKLSGLVAYLCTHLLIHIWALPVLVFYSPDNSVGRASNVYQLGLLWLFSM